MDLTKTNALLESVKKELSEAPATPPDADVLQKIAHAVTSGSAKIKRGNAASVVAYLEQHPTSSLEIVGRRGQAMAVFYPFKHGEFGGYGFNPQNNVIGDMRAAAQEMNDCLDVAESVWAIVKSGR